MRAFVIHEVSSRNKRFPEHFLDKFILLFSSGKYRISVAWSMLA